MVPFGDAAALLLLEHLAQLGE
ncbi:MAG: hypothetical protein JWM40_115, partial [Frankiales bacterium]|nr:hypothetical protein [Frankiales bacterium]